MPLLAKVMEEEFGFRTTVLLPNGNPEQNKNGEGIPGLEVLAKADVAIFFMRFLALEDDQFNMIADYISSGKPVVGFRTSTHAFKYPKDHPKAIWNNEFGRRVLRTSYIVHQTGATQVEIINKHRNHPILNGIRETTFTSPGSLYLTRLEPGCIPLALGTGHRKGERLVENDFGSFYIEETEKDIIAWAWENHWGGRVFSTSLGHLGDFAVEPAMRLLVNGICWAAGQPIRRPMCSFLFSKLSP